MRLLVKMRSLPKFPQGSQICWASIFATLFFHCSSHVVLKSTESSFENFLRDEYTTLAEVNDRIFSTSVDLSYTFYPVKITAPSDEKKLEFFPPTTSVGGVDPTGDVWDGDIVADRARIATLEIFASDNSASVQVCSFLHCDDDLRMLVDPTGDSVQDGAESDRRECPGFGCYIYPSEQALHPSQHGLHWRGQCYTVESFSSLSCVIYPPPMDRANADVFVPIAAPRCVCPAASLSRWSISNRLLVD
jgi:hypothetical protein